MRSMTGFGSAALEAGTLSLRAEVRAVNHRYLQIKVRMPPDLAFLEADVEELVKKRIDRGSIGVGVFGAQQSRNRPARIDHARAKAYARELAKLAKELGSKDSVPLQTVLSMPGVMQTEAESLDPDRERKALLKLVGQALDALDAMREMEGKALAKEFAHHASSIAGLQAKIAKRMPLVVRGHQEQLKRRVEDLLGPGNSVAPTDLAREIALLADRLDVREELSRLESHAKQLTALLKKDGSLGRQLDFLTQEFLREANTIGSKCNDAEVSHLVVELKTAIERLREQAQNVE